MTGECSGAAAKARRRVWQVAALAVGVAGTAAIAAPMMHQAGGHPRLQLASFTAPAPVAAPPPEHLVWEGADIDGDGQPDFANPTGHGLRTSDAYGSGAFGATRDGGERRHEGVDFMADAGQTLIAPMSGFVTKIGFAYPGDSSLRFVEISNPALHYEARVFYIDPAVAVGQAVHVGQPIGTHHTLEERYPGGMTDHVHLEVVDTHGAHIDATQVITARLEPVNGARG